MKPSSPNYHPAAFAAASSWQDTLLIADREAPHGFLIYARLDITPMLAGSSSTGKATEYLMGNHTIAETRFRYGPAVMLHAPLRTLIIEDRSGVTRFVVDQPSLQFASYGHPDIAAAGRRLDGLLEVVIRSQSGDVPSELAVAGWPARAAGPLRDRGHRSAGKSTGCGSAKSADLPTSAHVRSSASRDSSWRIEPSTALTPSGRW